MLLSEVISIVAAALAVVQFHVAYCQPLSTPLMKCYPTEIELDDILITTICLEHKPVQENGSEYGDNFRYHVQVKMLVGERPITLVGELVKKAEEHTIDVAKRTLDSISSNILLHGRTGYPMFLTKRSTLYSEPHIAIQELPDNTSGTDLEKRSPRLARLQSFHDDVQRHREKVQEMKRLLEKAIDSHGRRRKAR